MQVIFLCGCGIIKTLNLRKFNRSALEVVPWSFDGAVKYALGSEYHIDELWREYQRVMEEEK